MSIRGVLIEFEKQITVETTSKEFDTFDWHVMTTGRDGEIAWEMLSEMQWIKKLLF